MTYSVFYLFVGFECIRENQTFGQEVLKTLNAKGQGQIQAIGQARIPSTNYRKKYWCFRTKYRLHTHAWKTRVNEYVE